MDPLDRDPDHHLWRNGRRWWLAFTLHRGHIQERVRVSLGTDELGLARARRDELLEGFATAAGVTPSLRFVRRPRAHAELERAES